MLNVALIVNKLNSTIKITSLYFIWGKTNLFSIAAFRRAGKRKRL